MVLRTSTSTSPDCSAVKRSLADSGTNLTLFGIVEDRGGDGAAEIDVEAGPVALRVRQTEAGQRAVGAAIEDAAILHRLQRLGGCALRGKMTRASARMLAMRFIDATSLAQIRLRCPSRIGQTFPPPSGLEPGGGKCQSLAFSPSPSTVRISERSGCQVKGLTLAADAAVYAVRRRGSARPIRPDLPITMAKTPKNPLKPETRLVTAGRDIQRPITASSIRRSITPRPCSIPPPRTRSPTAPAINTAAAARPPRKRWNNALTELEGDGCAGVALLPSGLAAISTALLAVAGAGDHILVTDSVYRPTRNFCEGVFKRMGVETTYYDPLIGADIAKLFKPNTRAVFVEAPGSQSFEMQDIPAIAKVAHDKGALVLMDNTWATPLYFRAFEKGVDLSIQAGTKYIGGHSDVMFGCVSANAKTLPALKNTVYTMGLCVGPDDMYLALRGLRTLGVRLARHYRVRLARRALARAAAGSRARAASGARKRSRSQNLAAGFFRRLRIVQHRAQADGREIAVYAFMNELTLFGMGFSWGGFESLVISFDCTEYRTATKWAPGGPTLRFHIGLEDPDDLIADLERGFAAMAAANRVYAAAPLSAARA